MERRKPVTQAVIAQEAGVSKATVSFALRRHPSIPPATCDRIAKIAEELGYRPDPEVSRLMAHLRRGENRPAKASIGFINPFDERRPWITYVQIGRILEGIRDAGEPLGYSIDHLWLGDPDFTPKRMERILVSRGINGILLLGSSNPMSSYPLDLSRFSVTTIGYSIGLPMHRSCPNQYRDTLTALRNILRLGYHRPGIVLNKNTDRRVERLFLAAFLVTQHDFEESQKVPPVVAENLEAKEVIQWYEAFRPDVILVQAPPLAEFRRWLEAAGYRVPEDVGLVSLDLSTQTGEEAGIVQNHEAVGATALKLLVGQVNRSEKGLPDHPSTVLVNGSWMDGLTAPGPVSRMRVKKIRSSSAPGPA